MGFLWNKGTRPPLPTPSVLCLNGNPFEVVSTSTSFLGGVGGRRGYQELLNHPRTIVRAASTKVTELTV